MTTKFKVGETYKSKNGDRLHTVVAISLGMIITTAVETKPARPERPTPYGFLFDAVTGDYKAHYLGGEGIYTGAYDPQGQGLVIPEPKVTVRRLLKVATGNPSWGGSYPITAYRKDSSVWLETLVVEVTVEGENPQVLSVAEFKKSAFWEKLK